MAIALQVGSDAVKAACAPSRLALSHARVTFYILLQVDAGFFDE
jgi:hypothetical protein